MIESWIDKLAGMLPFGYSFGAGMMTAASPCSIVLLPAYISLNLSSQNKGFWGQSHLGRAARALVMSAVVALTFVTFFGAVGAIMSLGGHALIRVIPWIAVLIGVSLVLLGLYLLSGRYLYTNLPARLAGRIGNPGGLNIKGFLVFGIVYGISALSCALPVFLVVVASATALEGFTSGLLQFVSYALGMGFVILVVTIGSAILNEATTRWLRRLVPVAARLSSLLLVLAGGYIIYYWFTVGDIVGVTFQ